MQFDEDANAMSYELRYRSLGITILEAVISIFICGSAIFGNTIFCAAVFKNSHLRVSRNYFLISLAVSDVLISVMAMPLSTGVFILGYWPYGETVCQFQGTLSICMGSLALLTLTLTAVNRYFKMIKASHLYNKLFSRKSILGMIVCSWLLAAVVPVPYLISGNSFNFHAGKGMCYVTFDTKAKAYLVAMMVLLIAVPFSVINICYWKVFWKVRQHSLQVFTSRTRETPGSELSSIRGPSSEEIKITKLLITLVFAFTICWTPFFVVDLISFFRGDYALPRWVYVVYTNMVAANSSLNPIIYGVMNRQFRRAFYKTLFCCHRRILPEWEFRQNFTETRTTRNLKRTSDHRKKTTGITEDVDCCPDSRPSKGTELVIYNNPNAVILEQE